MASSRLLTPRDADVLGKMMEASNQQGLAVAVAKLFVTQRKSNYREWVPLFSGVVGLMKDYNRKSYYITVFDMDRKVQAWEQELYYEMNYKSPHSWFHYFEFETGVAGLCFADEQEAVGFLNGVSDQLQRLRSKQQRRSSRRAPQPPSSGLGMVTTATISNSGKTKKAGRARRNLRKEDISRPANFIHVAGVKRGEDGTQQLVDNSDQLSEDLRAFLKVANLNVGVMKDPTKRKEIISFVEENRVLQTMATANHRLSRMNRPVAPPPSAPAPVPFGTPTKPIRMGPAKAPPASWKGAGPAPSSAPPVPRHTAPSPSPSSAGAPPPPPPPPLPPPAPVTAPSMPAASSTERKPASAPAAAQVPRMNLMDEIRQRGGAQKAGLLSANDPRRKVSTAVDAAPEDTSLTSVLKGALDHIQKAANMSSSEGEEDESEGDSSWSDD